MNTIISRDGTNIAYDRIGQGPTLILVAGAFSYRKFPGQVQLAKELSDQFTVYNYDRRGRGDSGDGERYAIERDSGSGGPDRRSRWESIRLGLIFRGGSGHESCREWCENH